MKCWVVLVDSGLGCHCHRRVSFGATVTMEVDVSVVWRHFSFKLIVDNDAVVALYYPPYLRLFCNK